MASTDSGVLPARTYFPMLDGLRGLAALAVVFHHIEQNFPGRHPFGHAYLAVDLFFMLSGFVLGHAYDRRLRDGMTFKAFARARLTRVYPLIMIGLLIGTIPLLMRGDPLWAVALALACEALFLPMAIDPTGLYLLDGVQWSLTLELGANAVHAAWLHRAGTRRLLFATGIAAVATILLCHAFGSLAFGDRLRSVAAGPARVAFPYLAGMLLYRISAAGPSIAPRWTTGLFLAALAATLLLAGLTPLAWAGAVDPILVCLLFPPLILFGARMTLPPRTERVALTAGALSYALYAVHLPCALLVHRLWLRTPVEPLAARGAAFALAVCTALVAMRWVDRPARRWLAARGRRSAEQPGHHVQLAAVDPEFVERGPAGAHAF